MQNIETASCANARMVKAEIPDLSLRCSDGPAIAWAYFKTFFFRGNPKIQKNMFFADYGSLEALDVGKILLRVVGTICPPGNPHSEQKKVETFF